MVKKTQLNSLLGIVIMMVLDLYVLSFFKYLGTLNISIALRQCLKTVSFGANDNKLLKSILQYGKELLL